MAGLAFFAGGLDNSNQASNIVDIFNSTTSGMSSASLSEPRYGIGATSLRNLAFFAGGFDGTKYSKTVDIYNATLNKWSTHSLSVARMDIVAVPLADLVLFVGGKIGYTLLDAIDIYNVTSGVWSTDTFPTTAYKLAGTSLFSRAYFLAGNTVYIYDLAMNCKNGLYGADCSCIAPLDSSIFGFCSYGVWIVTAPVVVGGQVDLGDSPIQFQNLTTLSNSTVTVTVSSEGQSPNITVLGCANLQGTLVIELNEPITQPKQLDLFQYPVDY